eukprot:TRINITY_DN268_c1_g1_i2.p3 TRINITY_DN268_c1_g1~~TRINITY_DN268_c1_g1_i2.p3  ORF type:complete len:126 (-),score=19.37 TRINITY_DN268_c1_g1_i2:41-418(-)
MVNCFRSVPIRSAALQFSMVFVVHLLALRPLLNERLADDDDGDEDEDEDDGRPRTVQGRHGAAVTMVMKAKEKKRKKRERKRGDKKEGRKKGRRGVDCVCVDVCGWGRQERRKKEGTSWCGLRLC